MRAKSSHRLTPSHETVETVIDQIAELWPALADALARDGGAPRGEVVTTSSSAVSTLPVNADVLDALIRISMQAPATTHAAVRALGEGELTVGGLWGHLRHLGRLQARLSDRGEAAMAEQITDVARGWLGVVRAALGLAVPDRVLPEFCPVHDDPLVRLVVPGAQGQIVRSVTGPAVHWSSAEYVMCRHCETKWTPSQYLALGVLLWDAADRRQAVA